MDRAGRYGRSHCLFFSHSFLMWIQILFFVSGGGLVNQLIHSDGLNIKISNIHAERAIKSLCSL